MSWYNLVGLDDGYKKKSIVSVEFLFCWKVTSHNFGLFLYFLCLSSYFASKFLVSIDTPSNTRVKLYTSTYHGLDDKVLKMAGIFAWKTMWPTMKMLPWCHVNINM